MFQSERVFEDGGAELQEDLGGEGGQHGDHVQLHGDGAGGGDEQDNGKCLNRGHFDPCDQHIHNFHLKSIIKVFKILFD